MRRPESIFPAHILSAAPARDNCNCVAAYLNALLDERPDLLTAALPWAAHEDLADFVLTRRWTRGRTADLQALADIAEHPECDFWLALAILLRAFPDTQADLTIIALAEYLVARINDGDMRMRHSDTPVISPRGLELYVRLSADRPALQIGPDIVARARAHAAWLGRKRGAAPRVAMFNGAPIWAANHDQDLQ